MSTSGHSIHDEPVPAGLFESLHDWIADWGVVVIDAR